MYWRNLKMSDDENESTYNCGLPGSGLSMQKQGCLFTMSGMLNLPLIKMFHAIEMLSKVQNNSLFQWHPFSVMQI